MASNPFSPLNVNRGLAGSGSVFAPKPRTQAAAPQRPGVFAPPAPKPARDDTVNAGEEVRFITLPNGQVIPIKPKSGAGHLVRKKGSDNLFDPSDGTPYKIDPTAPTGLTDAFEVAPAKPDGAGRLVKKVGDQVRDVGEDAEWVKKQQEAATKKTAGEAKKAAAAEEKAAATELTQRKTEELVRIGQAKTTLEERDKEARLVTRTARRQVAIVEDEIKGDKSRLDAIEDALEAASGDLDKSAALEAEKAKIAGLLPAKEERRDKLKLNAQKAALREEAWLRRSNREQSALEREALAVKTMTNTGRRPSTESDTGVNAPTATTPPPPAPKPINDDTAYDLAYATEALRRDADQWNAALTDHYGRVEFADNLGRSAAGPAVSQTVNQVLNTLIRPGMNQATAKDVMQRHLPKVEGQRLNNGTTLVSNDTEVGTVIHTNGVPELRLNQGVAGIRHSPSLLSGNPYDGVPEYSAPTKQFVDTFQRTRPSATLGQINASEVADGGRTIEDEWQAQRWNAGQVNGLIEEWSAANDGERAAIVARLQPEAALMDPENPRLNTRRLFQEGKVSLQEARLLEREFYGIQPGFKPLAQAWEEYKASDAAKGMRDVLGDSLASRRQMVGALQKGSNTFLADYYKANGQRADFDLEEFNRTRATLMDDEAGWSHWTAAIDEAVQNAAGSSAGIAFGLGKFFTLQTSQDEFGMILDQSRYASAGLQNNLSDRGLKMTDPMGSAFKAGWNLLTGGKQAWKDLWNGKEGGKVKASVETLFERIDSETLTETEFEDLSREILRSAVAVGRRAEFSEATPEGERLALEDVREYYDPADPRSPLAGLLLAYQATRDPAIKAQFTSLLLSTPEEQALQQKVSDYASSNGTVSADEFTGPLKLGFKGAQVAPVQEVLIEAVSNLASVGMGKLLTGGAKQARRLQEAGQAMNALQKTAFRIEQAGEWFAKAGTREGATYRNFLIQGGKQAITSGLGEGFEESVAAFTETGASIGDAMAQGLTGIIGGIGLAPVHGLAGLALTTLDERRRDKLDSQQVKTFADNWNKTHPEDPITEQDYRQMRAYLDPKADQSPALAQAMTALANNGVATRQLLAAGPPSPDVLTPLLEERDQLMQQAQGIAAAQRLQVVQAKQAMQEINGIAEPSMRAFADAALRARQGVPLTPKEQQTLLNSTNDAGEVLAEPEPGTWRLTEAGLNALGTAVPWTRKTYFSAEAAAAPVAAGTAPATTPAGQTPNKQQSPTSGQPATTPAPVQTNPAGTTPAPAATPATTKSGQEGAAVTPSSASSGPAAVAGQPTGGGVEAPAGEAAPLSNYPVAITLNFPDGKVRRMELEQQGTSPEDAAARAMASPAMQAYQRRGAQVTAEGVTAPQPNAAPVTDATTSPAETLPENEMGQRDPAEGIKQIIERKDAAQQRESRLPGQLLKMFLTVFGYKIVDTGIPSGHVDSWGTQHNWGTQLFDKMQPGSDIGQWIDKVGNANPEIVQHIQENMTQPYFHRVWFGHDPVANIGAVVEQFGAGALPEYALQLLKDSTTKSGIPLPGTQYLVHGGLVGDKTATNWLSMNIGEALSGGLAILGTYKLAKRARKGENFSSAWAIAGVGFKLVGGAVQSNPVLIISGLTDAAILVAARPADVKAAMDLAAKQQAEPPVEEETKVETKDPVTETKGQPAETKAETPAETDLPDYGYLPGAAVAEALQGIPEAKRRGAIAVLDALNDAIGDYGSYFPGVEFETGVKRMVLREDDVLLIDVPDIVTAYADAPAGAMTTLLRHELIHYAVGQVMTPMEVINLWQSLPYAIQNRVYQTYFAQEIIDKDKPKQAPSRWAAGEAFMMGHEFMRALIEDSEFQGIVTEYALADPAAGAKIIQWLRMFVLRIREMIGQLPPEQRHAIGEYERRARNALREMLGKTPIPSLESKLNTGKRIETLREWSSQQPADARYWAAITDRGNVVVIPGNVATTSWDARKRLLALARQQGEALAYDAGMMSRNVVLTDVTQQADTATADLARRGFLNDIHFAPPEAVALLRQLADEADERNYGWNNPDPSPEQLERRQRLAEAEQAGPFRTDRELSTLESIPPVKTPDRPAETPESSRKAPEPAAETPDTPPPAPAVVLMPVPTLADLEQAEEDNDTEALEAMTQRLAVTEQMEMKWDPIERRRTLAAKRDRTAFLLKAKEKEIADSQEQLAKIRDKWSQRLLVEELENEITTAQNQAGRLVKLLTVLENKLLADYLSQGTRPPKASTEASNETPSSETPTTDTGSPLIGTPEQTYQSLTPLPSYFERHSAQKQLWDVSEEAPVTPEKLAQTIGDSFTPGRTAFTVEMLMYQISVLRDAVASMNGRLLRGGDKGASAKQLAADWKTLRRFEALAEQSKLDNSAIWDAYQQRQTDLASLPVGTEVLLPYPTPDSAPLGNIGIVNKKFPKNWRVIDRQGTPVLINPAGLRKPEPAPSQETANPPLSIDSEEAAQKAQETPATSPTGGLSEAAAAELKAAFAGLIDDDTGDTTPPTAETPTPPTPPAKPGKPEATEWQKTFAKFRAALAKAQKAKDWPKVLEEVKRFKAHYNNPENGAWPEQWSAWDRAEEDATLAMKAAKTPAPEATPPATPPPTKTPPVKKPKTPKTVDLLKAYFVPGRIVPSYGGYDRVLSLNLTEGGGWNVTVEEVVPEGRTPEPARNSSLADLQKIGWVTAVDAKPRNHMTLPPLKDMVAALEASKVSKEETPAPTPTETPAAPASSTGGLSNEAADQLKQAFKGLWAPARVKSAAEVGQIDQKPLPADKLPAFISLAATLVREGITTPVLLQQTLDAAFPNGNARPYAQALWDALGMVDTSLRGTHNWTALWGGEADLDGSGPVEEEAIEETPAAEETPPTTEAKGKRTRKAKAPADPAAKIGDFGEKIGGARKDAWKTTGLTVEDMEGMTEEERTGFVTKDQVFPAPNYAAWVESGMSPVLALALKKLRDALPVLPAMDNSYSRNDSEATRRQYVKLLGLMRDGFPSLRTNPDFTNFWNRLAAGGDYTPRIYGDGEEYMRSYDMDTMHSLGDYRSFKKVDRALDIVKDAAKPASPGKWTRSSKLRDYIEETGWPLSNEPWMRRYRITEFAAGTKIWERGTGHRTLEVPEYNVTLATADARGNIARAGFLTREAAVEWAKSAWAKENGDKKDKGEKLRRPLNEDPKRTGPDLRNDRSIAGKEIETTFGFRGGEFGNWTNQADRQQALNASFDALHDLARVLGIPPKAVSLQGSLGIAFGARGSGKASAHYEPLRMVINLTRTSGAGSLAHEWAHAFDNYIVKHSASANKLTFVSDLTAKNQNTQLSGGVRQELLTAYQNLMRVIAKRTVTQEEAIASLQKELEKGKGSFRSWLPRPMTEDVKVLAAITLGDQERVINGTRVTAREALAQLLKILPKETGYSSGSKKRANALEQNLRYVIFREERIARAEAGETIARSTSPTKYAKRAEELGPYWARHHEMFARAFETFVQSKLAETEEKNEYLVHSAKSGGIPPEMEDKSAKEIGWMAAYPQGEEAVAINKAFEELFATLKNEEVDGKVRLYAPAPVRASVEQKALPADKLGAFIGVAGTLIKEGVKTPERLVEVLNAIFPEGQARPYSQALWDALGMIDNNLRGTHDWTSLYKAPAETPAAVEDPAPPAPEPEQAPLDLTRWAVDNMEPLSAARLEMLTALSKDQSIANMLLNPSNSKDAQNAVLARAVEDYCVTAITENPPSIPHQYFMDRASRFAEWVNGAREAILKLLPAPAEVPASKKGHVIQARNSDGQAQFYGDTSAMNDLQAVGWNLDHVGFGDFTAKKGGLVVFFDRTDNVTIPGQVGRAHRIGGDPAAVQAAVLDIAGVIPDVQEDGQSSQTSDAGGPVADAADDAATPNEPGVSPPVNDGAGGSGGGDPRTTPGGQAPAASPDQTGGGGSRGGGPGVSSTDSGSGGTAGAGGGGESGNAAPSGGNGRFRVQQTDRGVEVRAGRDVEPEDNLRIQPDEKLVPSGRTARIEANIAAIRLLRSMGDRLATPEEKRILAAFSGWGDTFQVFGASAINNYQTAEDIIIGDREASLWGTSKDKFDRWSKQYRRHYDALREMLTDAEWQAAKESSLNAHYTSFPIIKALWSIAGRLGFKGGKALEPSAGNGTIIGLTPDSLAGAVQWTGIELDDLTAEILAKLYPASDIQHNGFEVSKRTENNSQDLVMTNFPFGDYPIADVRHPDYDGWAIHDYFLARSVDAAKPGGLVIAITSRFTLDGSSKENVRQYVANKADLVAAFRLPNNAFKENAGTEVVTDILILRKRDGLGTSFGQRWITTIPTEFAIEAKAEADPETDEETDLDEEKPLRKKLKEESEVSINEETNTAKVPVNEYFAENPHHILGVQTMTGSMYGGNQYNVEASKGADLEALLAAAIEDLPQNIFGAEASTEPRHVATVQGAKPNSYLVEGKSVLQVDAQGRAVKVNLTASKAAQAGALIEIRDTVLGQLVLENDPMATDEDVEANRSRLNGFYDAYVKKHGALNESDLIDDDPEWPLVAAMEKPETFVVEQKITKGKKAGQIRLLTREKWVKGPILQGRVNRPPTPPENAGSLEEALSISLAYQGRVALHYISQLMGKPLDQVAADLPKDGIAFEDPETGRWEPSDYYLSGFVRDKLEAARTAAEEDPARWEHNVAALEKVQPKKAPIVDASFRLGGAWLPPSTIEKWMRETLEVEARLKFMRVGDSTQWAYTSVDGTLSPQNVNQFGGGEVPAHELIEDSLNLKMAKVEDPVYDDNGKEIGKKVNPEKTEAARQAQERLQAHFRTWVLNNPAEALKVEDAFDQQFGGIVLRETRVPAIERFPGASENIMLRYWQKRVVARAVSEGTLVAHDVGTGKTFSLISISMEMRRLGVASKPMIVVQNSTLGQFARSYKTLYPGAKILVGNEKRTKGENRAQFVAQAALEDWDAVIIPQSFFERLANDPKREEAYVTNRMREIEDAILQAEREAGNTDAIDFDKATTKKMKSALGKNMLKVRKRYKARLDRIFQRLEDKGDVMLTFEQTGVDALLVDEAHAFKRGDFYTKMDPVKGLDTNGSDRSMDFFLKTQFIHQRTPDRNVVLATGTPISNTLAEMWTMLRYVRPGLLKKFNVETFDDFAGGFTRVQSAVVETPTGDFKEVLRLARYDNGPVINNLWRSAVDIYSMDRADLKDVPTVKGGAPQPRIIDRTLMMGRLTEFLRKWRRWYDELPGKDKRDFNWLSLVQYGLARKGAVDIRLVDPDLEDEPGSKTNKVVEDVWEQYQASSDSLGTQLIFSNLFQSHDPTKQFLDKAETAINPLFGRPVFNVFEDIKAKLIAKGIPENEIAIFTDFSNEQKTAIGELVNAGKIRVAMGSTETLGTGLNVQQKVTTIYHLDPQFRPMDFTQRNGRGIRQGNENKEIEIVPYGMKNTMDSVLYSLMMTKAGMVAQAMQGKLGKEFEDPSDDDVMNYQSMAAAFSGNPALARQFALRNELRQLEIGEEDHARRQSAARDEWGVVNRGKATFLGQVEQSRLAVERLKKAFPEGKATELTHNGKTIKDKDFAKALTELIDGVTSEMEETMNRRFQSGGLKADVEAEVRRRNPKSKDLSQEWWPSIGEERSLNFELNGVPIGMEFSLEANGYELRRGNLDLGPGMQGRWGIKTAGFAMLAFNEATPWYGRLETPVGRATTGVGLRNSLENAIRNHLDAASEERIAKALNLMEVRLDQHLTDSKRPWEQSARLTEVRERLVEVDAQLAADPDAETQEEGPNIGQIAEEFAEFGWLTRFGNDPRSADSRAAVEEKQRQKAMKLSHVPINGVWIEVKSKKVTLPDTKGQDWFMANYKDGKRQVWRVTNDASGLGLGAARTEAEALATGIDWLSRVTQERLDYAIARSIQQNGLMPRVAMVDGEMKNAFPLGARVRYQWATASNDVFETRAGRVSGIAPSKGTIDVMLDDGSTQTVPMRQTDIGRREMGLPEKSATAPTPAEQTVENQLSEPEKQEIADLMGKGQWPAARADFMKSFADFLAGTYTATGRLLEIMKRLAQKVAVVAVIAAVSFSSANSKVTEMIYPAAQAIKASAPQFKAPQMGMPAAESIFGRLPKAPILPAAPAISYMEAPPAAAPAKTADFNGENAPADVVKTANWVVQAGNNEGKPFVIADKRNGALFTFDKTGTLDSKTPALFGKEIGDIANPNAAMEDASAKVTPSGRFYGEVVADEEYGKTVDFYSSNKDWNIAIHKVYLGDPSERRATRLTSESATDNRISYGCINLPESGMKSLLRNFKDTQGGYVYVLPETPKGRAAFAKQIGTKLFAPKPVRGHTKEGAQNLRKVWHSGAIEGAYDPTKSALDSLYGPGFYTAESPKRAKGYGKVEPRPFYIQTDKTFDADEPVSRKETNALLAFLELPTDAADWLYDDQKETGTPVTGEDVWNLLKDATTPVLANDALKSLGYDSITYTNSRGTLRDWVVFEASQIKSADSIDTAAQQAATSPTNTLPQPTAAQKDAGNYQKGHARIGGLDITIENPAGSTRSGIDKGGKAWSIPMQDHYGYVKGTEGPDGDHLDVFIAPGTPTDYRGPVHVIEQGDKDGMGFDEHKAVIGVPTAAEAASLYQRNYAAGWNGGKAIQTMPWEVFKTWATSQHAAQPLDGRRRLFAPKALKKPKKGPPAPVVHTQTIAGEADLQQKQAAAVSRSTPLTRVFRQRDQFGRDVSNVWADFVSGNIDRIDYYAPGFRDIWLDTERNLALSRAAVNGLFQTLNARARAGFGYPAWWKNPKVWAQWRRFQAELLPVAARLEVDSVDDQGQFVWAPFNMRAGQISSQIVVDQNKKEGDTINAGNETLVVGPGFSRRESTAGTGRGKMVYYNLLLRPMSAEDQQAIYEEFVDSWQHFPVVKDLLDEFIMPGMDKARYVGPRQFRTAEFNRYALRDFFNEWPQEIRDQFGALPEMDYVAGYVPEVPLKSSTPGIVGVIGELIRSYTSPTRRVETRGLRERGDVKDLFSGFQTTLMQAHLEKVRMERRGRLLKAAAVPMNKIPRAEIDRWVPINDAFESVYDAIILAKNLDTDKYPALTGALNPDQLELMRSLVGEAFQLRGQNLAIPAQVFQEMLAEVATIATENLFLALLQWFVQQFNAAALASLQYLGMNFAGNEIMKMAFATQQAWRGVLLSLHWKNASVAKRRRLAFATFRSLIKGLFTDRFPLRQERLKQILPRELFDTNHFYNALDGMDLGVLDNIKRLQFGSAFLAAARTSNWDVGAKVQLANAIYQAHAREAWRDQVKSNPALKQATAAQKRTWLKNYVAGAPAELHREVETAAGEWLMNYENTPKWMNTQSIKPYVDPSRPQNAGKAVITAQLQKLAIGLLIPFIRWSYLFAKRIKRSTWNEGIKNLISRRGDKREGIANLMALGTMIAAPASLAFLGEGDDDDPDRLPAELLGRNRDVEGDDLDANLRTTNRFNASALARIVWTQMGLTEDVDFTLSDQAGQEQDLWMRYRNYPYIKEGIVMGLWLATLNQSDAQAAPDRIKRARTERNPNATVKDAFGQSIGALFGEYVSLGLGYSVIENIMANASGGQGSAQAQSDLRGTAIDFVTSPVLPHRLLRDVNVMLDPVDRRDLPSKNLGYTPGWKEAIMSRIPGLKNKLPMEGKVAPPAIFSSKSSVPVAEQKALLKHFDIPATAVQYTKSKGSRDIFADLRALRKLGGGPQDIGLSMSPTNKPMIAYPSPSQVRQRDVATEMVRANTPFNLLPVNRAAYAKAIRGQKDE